MDTILQFVKLKEKGRIRNLYVMGCLSERYKPELEKEIAEVDKYFGSNDIKSIIETLGYNYRDNLLGERLVTTPRHYAYLKISEGCDRQCSFCAIPLMRGKHRSVHMDNLVHQAKSLAAKGVKELILIAQDLTYYGVDINQKQQLSELLARLSDVEGIGWIRLHYAYPASFPKEVIRMIRDRKNICNYLDIPFQHISDKVLKKMRRSVTSQQTRELIDYFRSEIPDLALRTTLMTGHPGEGEKEYDELVQFVEKVRFDRLGVFTYSEEEDTFGARNFTDEVKEDIKQQRAEQIMEHQRIISEEKNFSKIGRSIKVLIDRKEDQFYVGRTEADSPEVDNEIIIHSSRSLQIGEFYEAKVTDAEEFDLIARI